ncbi:ATP-binding protein [Nocardia sp. NPDC051832]|uniref:ATP-binding protein n=1 Tax=Nocardia sp. NPDC051832 TaxID=3155673 RepID=UPI00343380B8
MSEEATYRDTVGAADAGSAELGPALRRLNRILAHALAIARESFGLDIAGDPFRGLYIDAEAAQRALRDAGGVHGIGDLEPEWNQILTEDDQWAWLARTYGLTELELDIVLIALAPEVDLRYGRVFGYLHDDIGQRQPTVDLALNLLTRTQHEKLARRTVFGTAAPLLRGRILTLAAEGRLPMSAQTLHLDPQIVDVLLGQNGLDRRLAGCCQLRHPQTRPEGAPVGESLRRAVGAAWRTRPLTVYFEGPEGTGRGAAAAALAAELGVPMLVVRAGSLPRDETFADLVAVALREALLHGALVVVEEFDEFRRVDETGRRATLSDQLRTHPGVAILIGSGPWVPLRDDEFDLLVVAFALPDAARRREIWAAALSQAGVHAAAADITTLAGRFRLSETQIRAAVRTAGAAPAVAELFAAARALSANGLALSARRITPRYGWDDIVLPEHAAGQLRDICRRVVHQDQVLGEWGFGRGMSQGHGISALFVGPPGTGKTMAAEVIAHELGLDLYKIDLSTVVSKYIGETEKNLERIFTAAPRANACLLFDEADAIFGKRSAVHDSHDRYANMEISYLLQRMEQYDGLAILTTNMRDNLDEAFVRRLQFIVEFPLPSEADRARIWRTRLPAGAPRDPAIDFERMARDFALSGAGITNILLGAAFRAAADDQPIGTSHVLAAVASEYRKMGKVVPEAAGEPA